MKLTKTIQSLLIASSIVASSLAYAVPNSFTAGQPARASEVNENFDTLQVEVDTNSADIQTNIQDIEANTNAINAIQVTTYDYRDYLASSTVTSKVFNVTGLCGGTDDTETRVFSRNAVAGGTEVTVTRTRQSSLSGVCQVRAFNYLNTDTERLIVSQDRYLTDGTTFTESFEFDSPVTMFTSNMQQGGLMGDAAVITHLPAGGGSTVIGNLVHTVAIVGVEDVTVPAGNYTGCLRVSINRESVNFGTFNRISWYCPGVGEVRRIHGTGDRIWELQSVIFAAP